MRSDARARREAEAYRKWSGPASRCLTTTPSDGERGSGSASGGGGAAGRSRAALVCSSRVVSNAP